MATIDEEKDRLIQRLSDQYAQNSIDLEEYERMLEYTNKIETRKEIDTVAALIEKISQATGNELVEFAPNELTETKSKGKHLTVFSWRTSTLKPVQGIGGSYTSLFGTNRIVVDRLPRGRTMMEVNSIFGLTEIIVPKGVRVTNAVTPIFSGIFAPSETEPPSEGSELHITGKAIFGNITIRVI